MSLTDQLAYYEMEADAIKKVVLSFVHGQGWRPSKYFYDVSYEYSRCVTCSPSYAYMLLKKGCTGSGCSRVGRSL